MVGPFIFLDQMGPSDGELDDGRARHRALGAQRKERIEQAKAEWKAGRFDMVPGDAEEFIPLPEEEKIVRYP